MSNAQSVDISATIGKAKTLKLTFTDASDDSAYDVSSNTFELYIKTNNSDTEGNALVSKTNDDFSIATNVVSVILSATDTNQSEGTLFYYVDMTESGTESRVAYGEIYFTYEMTGETQTSGVKIGDTDINISLNLINGAGGGSGDFSGPGSSTDNAIVRFNGTGGKTGQNSSVTIDDNGTVNIPSGQAYQIDGAALDIDDVTPTTTKGDLIVENGSNAVRLAVGSDNQVLTADSTQATGVKWAAAGSGDFSGPASSTDNAIVRFDGAGGKTGQDSSATVDDSGSINIPSGQAYSINSVELKDVTETLTNKTLTTPTIGSFANATHDHADNAGGGVFSHTNLTDKGTNTHAQIDTAITNSVNHIASTSNPHTVTKAQVGLTNVTNDAQVKKIGASTDNAVMRWDGTTGDTPQDSGVTIDDTGSINIPSAQTYKINSVAVVDQDVTSGSAPTLTGTNFTGIPNGALSSGVGIANGNFLTVDQADAADDDFAKFTASGIEGRSYSEVKTDLSLDSVENTAISTWAGSSNITTVGTIGTGAWQGDAIADTYVANDLTIAGGTIGTSDITLKQSTGPTNTAEGTVEWDTNDDLLCVGDGTNTLKMGFTQEIAIACSDETTALTTGTAKATFRMPNYATTLVGVRASVTTAPTGSALTVDINEGGTTVLSTKLTIDATEKTSTTAATAAVISDSALAADAEMTVDIDAIGSSVAGAGLKVYLEYRRA